MRRVARSISSPALSALRSVIAFAALLCAPAPLVSQRTDPLATPLPPDVVRLLAGEVSGQMAFNNLVKLAGAPWARTPEELSGAKGFYESEEIARMVRAYGIETVRLDRYEAPGTFDYPLEGELWVDGRRTARVPADPALIASGSRTGEVTGPLVYVPDVPADQVGRLQSEVAASPERYRGAVALMWSHPRGPLFEALDKAGVAAVISYNARERYLDPDQVGYTGGSYAQGGGLRLGLTVSWRQWSELLEDVERGEAPTIRARATVQSYPNRFETVYAWIPGTEPDLPGVVFTAHLFEGYTKRGTSDNMGGPAVQLEILRALDHLISTGQLPRPRRTLHFIWPNEISGTYEFVRRDPTLLGKLAININMDMVTEGLGKNNSVFTMSETPAHLASFYDGLAASVLNHVWRTNDVVYLPDSPRGRPGGQFFPDPMWEKNGSVDAFRFFIHEATGGSDHIVFNNASVGVPGIEFFTWPDQWYHTDRDLPENADPTQMKRVAFVGAATAWAGAALTDEMLPGLLDAVSDYGHRRVAERGMPRALEALDSAATGAAAAPGPSGRERDAAMLRAWSVLSASLEREKDALRSVDAIHTGSVVAKGFVNARVEEWGAYSLSMGRWLVAAAEARGLDGARLPSASGREARGRGAVPRLAPRIRGVETALARFAPYTQWVEAHPGAVEALGLSRNQAAQIQNFVDGKRTAGDILGWVRGTTGEPTTLDQVTGYLRILQEVGWIEM
ncbi:MAG TPA: M28 family peptidase [Longimicrobiales bacterium]|nr:M28 family peptidase [Longimicrobiales bacterium]